MTATCAVCEIHAESTFMVEGMDCREEVTMLERRFKNLPGLEDFSADLIGQRLHVKKANSSPNCCLAVPQRIPGKTNTRRKILVV